MKRPLYIKDEHLEFIDTFKGKKISRDELEVVVFEHFQYLKWKEVKKIMEYWVYSRLHIRPEDLK